jgi:hypothetical protein
MSDSPEFKPLKLETFANFRRKLILMLVALLPMIYVGFTTILNLTSERGNFVRTLNKVYAPVLFILLVVLIYAAYLHFFKRSLLRIQKTFNGEFQVVIEDPSGQENQSSGIWEMNARYVKIPDRFGTFRKQLFLTISCDGEDFASFFYYSSATYQVPEGFHEVQQAYLSSAPKYMTPGIESIFLFLRSSQIH